MNNKTMEVTILGWWGAFPQPGEATCSVMVRVAEGTLLLDCGSGTLAQYLCFGNAQELNGVLISHLHFDHMGDAGSLNYLLNHDLRLGLRKNKLSVYASATPELIRKSIETPFVTMNTLKDGMRFSINGLDVSAKKVMHTIECYAFRLEKNDKVLAYLTDTIYMPECVDFVKDADLLICEATISENTYHSPGTGHMSDIEAGKIAREANVKNLCLYHLPSDGDISLIRKRASTEFGKEVMTPDIKRRYII